MNLPNEIYWCIAKQLNLKDLIKFGMSCKSFYDTFTSDTFLKYKYDVKINGCYKKVTDRIKIICSMQQYFKYDLYMLCDNFVIRPNYDAFPSRYENQYKLCTVIGPYKYLIAQDYTASQFSKYFICSAGGHGKCLRTNDPLYFHNRLINTNSKKLLTVRIDQHIYDYKLDNKIILTVTYIATPESHYAYFNKTINKIKYLAVAHSDCNIQLFDFVNNKCISIKRNVNRILLVTNTHIYCTIPVSDTSNKLIIFNIDGNTVYESGYQNTISYFAKNIVLYNKSNKVMCIICTLTNEIIQFNNIIIT